MNNIKIKDNLQRAWLKVNKISSNNDNTVLQGEMFDGTLFNFCVPNHGYEDQGSECPPLVEVGYIGKVGTGICEVVLPSPSLSHGHNVRVSENSLIKWEIYEKIKKSKQ